MKKHLLYWLACGLIVITGCQKETSFETGGTPSDGSLQADGAGDCLPKTINGAYLVNSPLIPATNTITVQVNVNRTGTYMITTDTVNGYFFRTSGVFTGTGPTNVILRGNGTPFAVGVNNFIVTYDSTQCDIAVTVLPAGTGPAVFTFPGAGANCTGATVSGTYGLNVPLVSSTNFVTVAVNVTTPGTFTITTPTTGGMTFTSTGAFTNTGTQNVILTGSGTPTTSGANVIPVSAGAGSCNFTVNVSGPAAGTMTCASLSVQGVYTANTGVTSANNLTIPVNFTSTGAYTISSNTVDGLSFSTSGNAATTGVQTITVPAVGTPGIAGVKNFTLQLNGSATGSCPFNVTVQPAGGGAAVGNLLGSPNACTTPVISGTYAAGTPLTAANTVQLLLNVTTAGTYNITSNTVSGMTFSGNGNVATGASVPVTLTGSGTPAAAGAHTFTVSFGAGSTCTFVVNVTGTPPPPTTYFPLTTGSNWSYEADNDPTDSLYRYVIAATHNANGNVYNILLSNDGSGVDSSGYYRKDGINYYEWFDAAEYIGYDPPPQWSEYIFLKDTTVNSPWTSRAWAGTIGAQSFNIRFKYTITSRDGTVTVTSSLGAVPYSNVIVVKEEIEAELTPGVWTLLTSQIGYGVSYYSRGVGLIQFILYDSAGAEDFRMELRRHQVF